MKNNCLTSLILSFLTVLFPVFGFLQAQTIGPTKVIQNIHNDISEPLKDIRSYDKPESIVSSVILPPLKSKRIGLNDHTVYSASDPVIQHKPLTTNSGENPTVELNFSGINYVDLATKFEPPDTQGDVSPNHYFQVVNSEFAIWDKEGNQLLSNQPIQSIWEGFDDGQPFDGQDGIDPIVLYDEYADRWLFGTLITNPTGFDGSYILMAISTSSDPTHTWFRYAFAYEGATEDYEKFGVWHNGYYMTANEQTFDEGALTIFDREAMINGDSIASAIYFQLGNDYYGLLPADADGPLPPPDSLHHISLALSKTYLNTLDIYTTIPDWETPTNSTITIDTLQVAPYVGSVYGQIDQPVTSQIIFALADRLMYRLQYRNFGTHHTLLTNHSVRNTSTSMYGVRWYELRNEGNAFKVFQQGTFLPDDNTHRWMGSIAMNGNGDIALGYSVSNANDIFPSIRFTGQTNGAPMGKGVMDIPETSIIEGIASQTSSGRWGDYSMMTVDPSDDYRFWYTQEYTSGGNKWLTRVARINTETMAVPEPVAYWPMNEGDGYMTEDVSNNNNDGSLQYGADWVEGNTGYAIGLDGTNDRINCGAGPEMDIGVSDFSFSTWIKMNETQSIYPTLMAKGAGNTLDTGYWIFYRYGVLWLYLSDGSTRLQKHSSGVVLNDDNWHHIAITIDRDGNLTFYCDGIEKGVSDVSAFNSQDISSSKSLTLGSWQSSSSTFLKGSIDDTRLFNQVLTPEAVLLLSGGDNGINYPPVIVQEASAEPSTVVLPDQCILSVDAEDQNFDFLTYSWYALSGPDEVSFTPNYSGYSNTTTATFSSDGNYTLQVAVSDGIDTVYSEVEVAVLPEEAVVPVAYWPMDEGDGNVTEDLSVNENDGILKNGTAWVSGVSGSALYFDGVNDRVDCGNSNEIDVGMDDFSVSAWVKMDTQSNSYPTLLSKGGGSASNEGYWIFYKYGVIWFYLSNGTSRLQTHSVGVDLTDDIWHHVVVSVDRDGDVTFYLDALNKGTSDVSSFNGQDISSSTSFTMGSWQTSSFSYLNGSLDDVRLFNTLLSAASVSELYNQYVSFKNSFSSEIDDEQVFDLKLYPNPFGDIVNIGFRIEVEQKMMISVYNIHGELVKLINDAVLPRGKYTMNWDGKWQDDATVQTGVYIVRIVTANNIHQMKIVRR